MDVGLCVLGIAVGLRNVGFDNVGILVVDLLVVGSVVVGSFVNGSFIVGHTHTHAVGLLVVEKYMVGE
jgi:hypothetical protein